MGLFGSSGGDTSGNYGSGDDTFASKLRSPSSELDFSDTSVDTGAATAGDLQSRIEIETHKAELVGQVYVSICQGGIKDPHQ